MILPIIGETGAGKTLCAVCYAYALKQLNPDLKIIANFHIFMEGAIYSPFLLMPFSELTDSEKLVILDDVKSLRNLNGFITFLASASRKANTDIIITGQYYTHIPAEIRGFSTYDVSDVSLDKDYDVLILKLINKNGEIELFGFERAIELCGKLYNTKQINELPSDLDIENELLSKSKTLKDLSKNAQMLYGNRRERASVIKKLKENFKENGEKRKIKKVTR